MSYTAFRRALGESEVALNAKYPWKQYSVDTLQLQKATNVALQAAGYCHIPASGVLEGFTCGARNFLTVHSREFFGNDMLFANPPACKLHPDELTPPTAGCFEPTELKPGQKIGQKLTQQDWILIGGVASVLLAGYLALKGPGVKRAKFA